MKKILLIAVTFCVLCAMTGVACAERQDVEPTVHVTAVEIERGASGDAYRYFCQEVTQTASRTVTVYREQLDGSYDEGTTLTVPVASATYGYQVIYDRASGLLVGGVMDGKPKADPAQNVPGWLEVEAAHTQHYSSFVVRITKMGHGYTADIVGGYATVSYNTEIWYHLDGTYTLGGRTTEHIGYYLNESGTLEELLGH